MTVVDLREYKTRKEVSEKEKEVELCYQKLLTVLENADRFNKRYVGKYSVILENRAGMLMRKEFNGLPPERWRLPVPTKITAGFSVENMSPFGPMPEIIEFRFVKMSGSILYYKEIT